MRGQGIKVFALMVLALALAACSVRLPDTVETAEADGTIQLATFEVDASPPVGAPLAYNPTEQIEMPLSARGIVLIGRDKPIVLLAVDWIGIGNGAHDAFRRALADAADTTEEHVSVHSLHQHDAPIADLTAETLFAEHGIEGTSVSNRDFVEKIIARTADALRRALENDLEPITHVGMGVGIVEKVASNRRLIDREGKVYLGRMSSTTDPEAQEAPVGTIDPEVKLLSFWTEDEPVVALSYYATHPQSYYRTGKANPDFPGIARAEREEATGVHHIHFTGAAGNVAAGKWNDGSTEMRQILADRLASGMAEAWNQTERVPVTSDELEWRVESVVLPPGEHLQKQNIHQMLADTSSANRVGAARDLAFLQRSLSGHRTAVTGLRIGPARVLHTPGELAVEYQLEAESLYPGEFIANASYTDYGPGYISTEIQYKQGGYEASERASRVAPEVDRVLRNAIEEVLAFDALQPDSDRLAKVGYRLERSAVRKGFDGEYSWGAGRAGVLPASVSNNPISMATVVLTAHQLDHRGGEVLQGLQSFRSRDLGLSWEGPFDEPALEKNEAAGQLFSGFVPKFHAQTNTLLSIGQTVASRDAAVSTSTKGINYVTFDSEAQVWSGQKVLLLPRNSPIEGAVTGAAQRLDLEDGSILLPVYFKDDFGELRVSVLRCMFDGEELSYADHGNAVAAEGFRHIFDLSLAEFGGRYFLALGTDKDVYVARSGDGLSFGEFTSLSLGRGSSPTVRWAAHSSRLYLAYAPRGGSLFLAQADPDRLELIEETEEVIVSGQEGARIDQIDVTEVSEEETWIIATEWKAPPSDEEKYARDNVIHVARLNWLEGNGQYRE